MVEIKVRRTNPRLCIAFLLAMVATGASAPIFNVEIVAGGGTNLQGPAKTCLVTQPFGVAFDSQDNMYVVCETSRLVRVDQKTGMLTLLCDAKATNSPLGYGGPVKDALLRNPHDCVMGPGDQLYIANSMNQRVLRYDTRTEIVHLFAGNDKKISSGDGGPSPQAGLDGVACLYPSADLSTLFIGGFSKVLRAVDLAQGTIRTVTGVAGSRAHAVTAKGDTYSLAGGGLRLNTPDGKVAMITNFSPPLRAARHLWADGKGNILIADAGNHLIRKYVPATGDSVVLAGTGTKGSGGVPGPALTAQLNDPHGVCIHPRTGDIYISDSRNHRVLRMYEKSP